MRDPGWTHDYKSALRSGSRAISQRRHGFFDGSPCVILRIELVRALDRQLLDQCFRWCTLAELTPYVGPILSDCVILPTG